MYKTNFLFTQVLILLISITASYGQNSNYFVNDSAISVGVKFVEKSDINNAKYILVKNKNEVIKYTPEDLTEYGFADGTVYKSKTITVNKVDKKVFLQRLVRGKLYLYRYVDEDQEIFYLSQDSENLVNLENSKAKLSRYMEDCEYTEDWLKLFKFNKKSLKKLFENYNDCKPTLFPFPRIGLVAGTTQNQLQAPKNFIYDFYENMPLNASSFLIGAYFDTPLLMPNFSFLIGINFQKNAYCSRATYNANEYDVVLNHSSVRIPLLLRYRVDKVGLRPFFNAGGNLMYHFENNSEVYESFNSEESIIIDKKNYSSPISDYFFGYSGGAGIEYNLDYRRIVSAEVRFYQSMGIDKSLYENSLQFLIGLSF